MADDFDKLLGFDDGEDDFITKEIQSTPSVEQALTVEKTVGKTEVSSIKDVVQVQVDEKSIYAKMEPQNEYPSLIGIQDNSDYVNVANRLLMQYKMLPYLQYDEIYKEMSELSIKSCPTPTLSVLNFELERVQAAKDRLSEIFVDVIKNHTFKKRAVDILRDSWGKFSNEKSADRRKGEAAYIVSDFESDFALTEAMLKSCMHILKNLDSLHDNLSRRITIIQLQLKLHDVGRGALPDFNFDRTPSFIEEIEDSKNDNRTATE
jgi:hypothetical protein